MTWGELRNSSKLCFDEQVQLGMAFSLWGFDDYQVTPLHRALVHTAEVMASLNVLTPAARGLAIRIAFLALEKEAVWHQAPQHLLEIRLLDRRWLADGKVFHCLQTGAKVTGLSAAQPPVSREVYSVIDVARRKGLVP